MQTWLIVGGLVTAIFISNPHAFLPDGASSAAPKPKPDFLAFYAAGVLLWQDPSSLYDDQRQARIQSEALGETIRVDQPGFMPFVYPAAFALLFVPLGALPYPMAYLAMLVVNVFLVGIALDLLASRFHMSIGDSRLLILCATLSISVILTLANGQVSFIPFIILIMVVSHIRGESDQAGVWAGLLALKPTFMPVLLLWFAVRRQWKSLAYAVMTGGAVALVSVCLTGPSALKGYSSMSFKMANGVYATVNSARMPNIRGLVEIIGYGNFVAVIISVVVLALLLWKARDSSISSCCALILAMLLVAPHIHYQDLNPIWIIVALMMADTPEVSSSHRWLMLVGTLTITGVVVVSATYPSIVPILPMALLSLFLATCGRAYSSREQRVA
jgi:hypothetical protein